jgi:tetratricopeptide (TPR) repeat protein
MVDGPTRSAWKSGCAVVMTGRLVVAVLLSTTMPGLAASALAQQAAFASTGSVAAQQLAEQALVSLRRGEDGLSKETRLQAYREGLELARRAVAADELNADAHFAVFANHGRILLLEGAVPNPLNLLEVNRELDRALELDPNHADALASKGGLYRQLPRLLGGSQQKAEECLNRAIEIDPDAVGARIELARLYQDMGQPDRGLPLLHKAVDVAERDGKYRQLCEARELIEQIQPVP